MSQISPGELNILNTLISQPEVQNVISKLSLGKAPGLVGNSGEFYKIFGKSIAPLLTSLYNVYLGGSTNPPMANTEHIKLLPKPCRDPLLAFLYRPIALINTDLKILSKIIVFLENPRRELTTLLQHLQGYGQVSGFKINASKSELMFLTQGKHAINIDTQNFPDT